MEKIQQHINTLKGYIQTNANQVGELFEELEGVRAEIDSVRTIAVSVVTPVHTDKITDWEPNVGYVANQEVTAVSPTTGFQTLYRRTNDGTSGATFDATEEANWTVISSDSGWEYIDYDQATYTTGIRSDVIYRSLHTNPSTLTIDNTGMAVGGRIIVAVSGTAGDVTVNLTGAEDIIDNGTGVSSIVLKPGYVFTFQKQAGGTMIITGRYPSMHYGNTNLSMSNLDMAGVIPGLDGMRTHNWGKAYLIQQWQADSAFIPSWNREISGTGALSGDVVRETGGLIFYNLTRINPASESIVALEGDRNTASDSRVRIECKDKSNLTTKYSKLRVGASYMQLAFGSETPLYLPTTTTGSSNGPGNAGQVLMSQGADKNPMWGTVTATAARYEDSFINADWVVNGSVLELSIPATTHGLGGGFKHVSVFDNTGDIMVVQTNVDQSSGDVTLTVPSGSAFTGSYLIS